jgi:hypothetical protein
MWLRWQSPEVTPQNHIQEKWALSTCLPIKPYSDVGKRPWEG